MRVVCLAQCLCAAVGVPVGGAARPLGRRVAHDGVVAKDGCKVASLTSIFGGAFVWSWTCVFGFVWTRTHVSRVGVKLQEPRARRARARARGVGRTPRRANIPNSGLNSTNTPVAAAVARAAFEALR